jgi:hypothetical protein
VVRVAERFVESCAGSVGRGCVTIFFLRGLFGRSCLFATVPQPVPSWDPADCDSVRARAMTPDTDKIYTIVLRDSKPLQSGSRLAAMARSRGHLELAGSRRDLRAKAANRHRHKVDRTLLSPAKRATLAQPGRRIGQRWEPTRAPRQGSERNGGGPTGSPLFFSCDIPIPLRAFRDKSFGGSGDAPRENTVFSPLSYAAVPSNASNSLCFRISGS